MMTMEYIREQYITRSKRHCQRITEALERVERGGISIDQEIKELTVVLQYIKSMNKIIKGRHLWIKT